MKNNKKFYGKRKGTLRRKAVSPKIPRGGFINAANFRRIPVSQIAPVLENIAKAAAAQDATGNLQKLHRTFGVAMKTVKDGTTFYHSVRNVADGFGVKADSLPTHVASEVNSIVRPRSGSNTNTKTYKTTFTTGNTRSKLVKTLSAEHGTRKVAFSNTQVDHKTNSGERQFLSFSNGFNTKAQVMFKPDLAFFSLNDWYEELVPSNYITPADAKEQIYMQINYQAHKYRISNSNFYLPVVVKIHICDFDRADAARDIFNSCFSQDEDVQATGAMPNNLLFDKVVNDSRSYAMIDNRSSGFAESPIGKAQITKIKTFSRVLQPGDVWEFTHKHYFGSGMNFTKLIGMLRANDVDSGSPMAYAPIFEVSGKSCEAVNSGAPIPDPLPDIPPARYIGTGPGTVSFEMQKYYEKVVPPTRNVSIAPTQAASILTQSRFYVRAFTNQTGVRGNVTEKAFHRLPNNIVIDPDDTYGVDNNLKVYIPVTTDKYTASAGNYD